MMKNTVRDILTMDSARFEGGPYGWIQWKGTQVCIDLFCACGKQMHADAEFLYSFRCEACGRHYLLGSHVAVFEVPPDEIEKLKEEGYDFMAP